MQSPVTSTRVATKGAELAAGSNPRRRRRNGNKLPPEYSEPIAQFQFPERQSTDNQGSRLRTRIAATADDQGNKQRQDDGTGDLSFKETHRGCRKHLA